MSQTAGKAHSALLKARARFGKVLKTHENTHFKNKYADLQAVLDAVDGPLGEEGLLLLQRPDFDEHGAYLLTELVHVESGERITARYRLAPSKQNDPQAMGGAMTYARRYCALAMLGLAPEDDDGETAGGRGRSQQPRKQERAARQPAAGPERQAVSDDKVAASREKLQAATSLASLATAWTEIAAEHRPLLLGLKDELKAKLLAGGAQPGGVQPGGAQP